jgi:acetylornithine deacetylase/succinyl-diaminopimelate desuccinylase-like protein
MPQSQKRIFEQLRQLVGTPSVSSTDPGWDQGNRAVIDLLANWLADMGFHVEIQPLTPQGDKANLIATLGSGPRRTARYQCGPPIPVRRARCPAWRSGWPCRLVA